MILNYIWIGFFIIAFIVALIRTFNGEIAVFGEIVKSTFDMAETGFTISIGLTGVLCLWMGIMKIGENGGAIQLLSRLVGPFFNKLFPDVPADHPARGSMLMNFSANMLGLDNAATPMGLKAMNELQELNDKKDRATNAMIMFLVLNTSGLTIIPVTVMTYRSQFGAADPADIFIPILIATYAASLVGLITVAVYQKINLFDKVILAYLGGMTAFIVGLIVFFNSLSPEQLTKISSLLSNVILFGIIIGFILMALRKKVNIYESFIEGAKGGFDIAIKIIPYLVAILVAIGVFRTSGAMDYMNQGLEWFFGLFMENTQFVKGLPTAIMKPLSGSGARGMMIESFETHGVDSFVGKLNATLQGATDTTFYIIAVYFGAVGIKKTRYAIKAGLIADLAGIIAAIIIASIWFGEDKQEVLGPEKTVEMFATAWEERDGEEMGKYLNEDCFLYDQSYDTIAKSKDDVTKFLNVDYEDGRTISTEHIAFIDVNETEFIYLKVKINNNNVIADKTYEIKVKKDKIQELKYLGEF